MTIPLEVLQKWAKPGRNEMSKQTYAVLRDVLLERLNISESDIYLQGSYRNHTNVRDNSDIDIVVEFGPNTNVCKVKDYVYGKILNSHNFQFTKGSKTVKYKGYSGIYVPADIVPCVTVKGEENCVKLYDSSRGTVIKNYPKVHIHNGEEKSGNTNGNFKNAVRILKNARNYLNDKGIRTNISSYTIECMLYNIPDTEFQGNESEVCYNTLSWLLNNKHSVDTMRTQDDHSLLFMNTNLSIVGAKQFINDAAELWNNWGRYRK